MVFEGDTSQFFTETPSSFTDAEWENIRVKNLELAERHGFVAIPGTEHFNTLAEDELTKIDKLSDADLDEMVERTLNSQSFSQNIPATVTQSVIPSFQEDLSNQKTCNALDLLPYPLMGNVPLMEAILSQNKILKVLKVILWRKWLVHVLLVLLRYP